ncbi:MAG: LysR family transcriptional regulator [Oscillospiraceae bacterium]|jgi:DNA-binding transcriptional LysR family regulator|nr:LysR family transcriptional regulator [Oscillospiraceae bacterium]
MNEKQLSLFLTVADQGSFSKAEEIAYISKQAMLRQINSLEAEAGVRLLDRSASGVRLTPAGQEFYQGAKELLVLWEEVLTRCRGAGPSSEVLRIGQVEHQTLLHRVTDAFAAKYPDIRIQKVIHPNHSGEFRVSHSITDVGETFYNPLTPSEAFSYTKLADMPYRAAMRRGHPLSGEKSLSLSQLAEFPTVLFRQMVKQEYQDLLTEVYARLGKRENLLLREDVDNQVEAAFHCGASDTLLLTANGFVTEIPELAAIPLDTGWSEEYGVIYHPAPSPTVRKYVDLAVTVYRELTAKKAL